MRIDTQVNSLEQRTRCRRSPAEGRTQICLLGASFNTENRGVAALAAGAIASALHSHPQGTVFLLDYAKSPARYQVRHAGGSAEIELINIRFSKKIFLRNNIARLLAAAFCYRCLPSRKARQRFLSRNPVLRRVADAETIGAIAGGDSFSDIYGFTRLLYVALPQILILILGKPLILLPQTLGPFRSGFSKVIARYIMRRAKIIYGRDRQSLEHARQLTGGEPSRFRFSYDLAFALDPAPPSGENLDRVRELENCRPLVGLNVSGLLYADAYGQCDRFGLQRKYPELIRRIVEYFVQAKTHILLVPHVFGSLPYSESDFVACREVYRDLKQRCAERLHFLDGDYDQHEVKFLIGRCDFFLGSRMHACIAALSQSIPAAGLAYSGKFLGVFHSIGEGELAVDLSARPQEEILEWIAKKYENRESVRTRLASRMPAVRDKVLQLFSELVLGG